MFGGHLLPLPVHARRLAVIDLHAIHSYVPLALTIRLAWTAGDHTRKRDETSAVLRPALQDGKVEDAEPLAQNDFLTRSVFRRHQFGKKLADVRQHGKHANLVEKTFRGTKIHQFLNADRD